MERPLGKGGGSTQYSAGGGAWTRKPPATKDSPEKAEGVGSIPEGFKPLVGTDEATIDDKGRILFSKKKRERLGESFTIALGPVGCLAAYPDAVWNDMVSEILSHKRTNQGREQYTRLVLGYADDELSFDGQGRVVVPRKLRDLARLKDEVVLVGCGDRVEIWAKDEYDRYNEDPDNYGAKRREAIENAELKMER